MSLISDADKKDVFFYADDDAKYYDIAEELTQPHMGLIHDTMVDLIEYSLTWIRKDSLDRPFYVLDIASGTGAEAFRLLERFGDDIHIVAIDFSPPMNDEFKRKFKNKYPDKSFDSQISLIEDDFFSENCNPDNLISLLPKDIEPRMFDAIIGGFFLHHYHTEIKQLFFKRAYNLLREDGVLVLCEAMSFQSKDLSEFAHDFGERWMKKQFSEPDEYLRDNLKALGDDAPRLKKQWIEHWNKDHIYTHDANLQKEKQQSHLIMPSSYADIAFHVDFKQVGFPFRYWEVGIMWSLK